MLEEIGLRGFALRRLLARHSALTATLIVAIPWALVHFALIVLHPPDGRAALAEGLSLLAMAVPHTWVFIKSQRNVWVATILHWAFNVMGSVAGPYRAVPEAESFWYMTVSACVIAAALILFDWRTWFARPAGTPASKAVPSAA